MKRLALLAAVLSAAACKPGKPAPETAVETRAVVGGVAMIDYDAKTGAFSCRAPADWRTLEDAERGSEAVFFGPDGARLSITRYPAGGPVKTPQDYRAALQESDASPSPLETIAVAGRAAYALHSETRRRSPHGSKAGESVRDDAVLVPSAGGFFALKHSAPLSTYRRTLPVFDALVQSFRPKD